MHTPSVVSWYGLFRRITGVGPRNEVARPEIVLEGSRDGQVWEEYEFHYKPGAVAHRPPMVAPHQPRLDWQMWFAALGNYQTNPWFLHLCVKLLQPPTPVLDRMLRRNPFPDAPPMYLRASHGHYDFTRNASAPDWWHRTEWVREYLPMVGLVNLESVLDRFHWRDIPKPPTPTTPVEWVAVVARKAGDRKLARGPPSSWTPWPPRW